MARHGQSRKDKTVSCVVFATTESHSELSVTAPTGVQLCATRPSGRVALAGLPVQGMPSRQDGAVARVPLGGADVADAAVAMLDVVKAHELVRPGLNLLTAGEAPPS